MRDLLILAVLLSILIACTPKVTEQVVEKEVIKQVEEPVVDSNPCTTLDELNPSVKDEVETAYVLYKDQVKQKNFTAAMPLWEKAYYGAPAANGRIKYQFDDGLKIYKYLYEQETDDLVKKQHVDSIMSIYNKRVECFGEEDYVAGRKAFDMYYYYNAHSDEDEIYELFKQSLDGQGKDVDYFVVNPFTKLLSERIIGEKIPVEEGRRYANILWSAIEKGTASGKNKEAWEIINAYAPLRLENLEGIEGLYDCAYYEKKYLAEFRVEAENCDVINKAYGRLLWGGCDKSAASVTEVAQAKKTHCYVAPPPDGPLKRAYSAYTEGRYKEAVGLFDEFIAKTSDPAKKFKYLMLVAKIYYGDIKNYPTSRKYAREASKLNPSSGEPYLLIGKLYASSGPLCGPGRGWDSQVVTWPAIDKFMQAKKDPAVADEAAQFIRTYKQYMPSKEDIFLRGISAGSSYKVPCWIQENTTVRTAD